jgi:flagella basal body P-ring formation protein FlgA
MNAHTRPCKSKAVIGALLMLSAAAANAAWQDTAAIRAAAEATARQPFDAMGGDISVAADALDPRLLLPACDQPLAGDLPPTGQETSRVTVEVRCPGSRPWRLFVPVRVTVRKDILVAAVPLERGKLLAAGDVILAQREVGASPGGYFTTADAAVGQIVRRSVPAGTVLSPAMLDAPVLIRRGQSVTLAARSGPIAVQMAGVARSDGALGQVIGVENTSSRKVLQGIVLNEKSVEILVP